MSASSDVAAAPAADKRVSRSPGIGLILLILLISFCAYYLVHVQQQNAYFSGRNLRILRTVSSQVQERIARPGVLTEDGPGALVWNAAASRFFVVDALIGPKMPSATGAETLNAETVLRPVFGQSFVEVFDLAGVADHTGKLVWENGAGRLVTVDQLPEVKTLRATHELRVADLKRRPHHARIVLEGREYRFFSHPFPVTVEDARGRRTETWLVVGATTRNRFVRESIAISYTLLTVVLAVFLLTVFSLPFLKLALLGALQRVRVTDILMLWISLLCITAVLTIVLMGALAHARLRSLGDVQLRWLASDIKRQMLDELDHARAVLKTLEALLPPGDQAVATLPGFARNSPVVKRYPYFESFARIDANGLQRQKWFLDGRHTPTIPVRDRDYFNDAVRDRGWGPADGGRHAIEPIRSTTTGVHQVVLSRRVHAGTESRENAVVALSYPMLSLIDTVVAGECKFVVIDDDGAVVFHSDSERNGIENFFVETDQDRNKSLRAAVIGRQNEMVNLSYWGEEQRAFVTPVNGTPWTLVTFRSNRLLQTLDVEMIIITLTLLLIYALGYVLIGGVIAIVAPAYRAPWVWPNRNRSYDYRRLIYAYAAFSVSFAASIYLYRPRPLLLIAFVLPVIAVLVTYLRLEGVRGAVSMTAVLLTGALSVLWLIFALDGPAETDLILPATGVRLFALFSGIVGILSATSPPLRIAKTRQNDPFRHLLTPAYAYSGAAVLLLVVAVILPTAALYKAAFKIELESFVKHGQMSFVRQIESRFRRLEAEQVLGGRPEPVYHLRRSSHYGVYYNFFLYSKIYRAPDVKVVARAAAERERAETRKRLAVSMVLSMYGIPWRFMAPPRQEQPPLETITGGQSIPDARRNPLPAVIEALLPQYSTHSIKMREMLHSRSSDDRWRWSRRGDFLDFESTSVDGLTLVTTSAVPRLLPRWWQGQKPQTLPLQPLLARDDSHRADVSPEYDALGVGVRRACAAFLFFGYAAFVVGAIYFITRKVFLVDLSEPLWLDASIPLGPALGGNVLVFARDAKAALQGIDLPEFIRVDLANFDADKTEEHWQTTFTSIDLEPPGKGVLIPDLDHDPGNAVFTELKLRFIESAIRDHMRNVVAITTVSPWTLFEPMATRPGLGTRWKALLTNFTVRIDGQAVVLPPGGRRSTDPMGAIIPTLKYMWRALKRRTREILSKQKLASMWTGIHSWTVVRGTVLAALAICRRPLAVAIRRLSLNELMNGSPEHANAIIERETAGRGPFLEQLGSELKRYSVRGEEEIYDEIGERALTYYQGLWTRCSREERMVLMHLAADGFANAKDRQIIRRLLALGLVRRAPNFTVLNETFRRFVLGDARRVEVAAFDSASPTSAWDRIHQPLVASLIAGAVFFFVTQRELFDASMTIVSGLAGGIPAFFRIVGIFVEPKSVLSAGGR